jgi:serine/threonine-protein kinase
MGVVFGATHLITHKRVAIKWLAGQPGTGGGSLSETTQRFVREARLAGEFHHPNVVQVYDLGESDGSFYMVMEWLEGESLAARLERVKRLSFEQVCELLIPCMHAMQRAHDGGIIHRDIKPANIFLCAATADRPALSKVLDFGISKRITASADMSSFVTKTGMLVGTPHYLAPEQLRARPVDRRTDIYGFGVLLYQTLAGELPFIADNFGDLVVEISVGTPRSLRALVPDLPVGVEQVVARAMARDPDERFGSLHELIASLNAIDPAPLTAATLPQLINPTSSIRPISTPADDPSPVKRPLLWLGVAACILAVAAGLMLFERDSSANVDPRALVRPRAIAAHSTNTAEPEPEVLAPEPVEPNTQSHAATSQLPQLDASIDSGRPIPLDPIPPREPAKAAEAAPSTKPKPAAAAPARVAVKPAALDPADYAIDPPPHTGPAEPQPTAAPPRQQPAPDPHDPEHNPLHMDIQ